MSKKRILLAYVAVSTAMLVYTVFAEPSRHGRIIGQTVRVVSGWPGAITGNPDPNWKPPEPSPVPNIPLY